MEEENRRRGEEDTKTNIILVEREEKLLLSNSEHNPTLRIGKFLNPSVTSLTQASPVPSVPLLSETIAHNLTEWPSNIHFKGWKNPQSKWENWVNQLDKSHCSIWKKSSVYDSIRSSIYKFEIDKNLILGLVEFWCPETSSFILPWGETTITLEDVFILGGYSVLGLPVTSPLEGDHLMNISAEIHEEYRACNKAKARKASDYHWLKRFMGSNSELEHVAFISLWLSRFVFPGHPENTVRKQVFPVAIHLAQGTRMALAPAILSGLYRELTLLKERVVVSGRNAGSIMVWGPFMLVQMWAWERFPPLKANSISLLQPGEPRLARWQKLKSKSELSFVRSTLCSSENFQWRPYVVTLNNWRFPLFYMEREELLDVQPDDDELMSFFCCLRACEIIGLDGFRQHYLPHRVAMQFGFDQDLPGKFSRPNAESLESDWKLYEKSTRNVKSFVRSWFLESGVTLRYSEWWNSSMSTICTKSQGAETEEVASEDEDDKLPIATILQLGKHQNGTHKPSSSPNAQALTTLRSSILSKVGGKKRKLTEQTDKELVEKVAEKEEKLGSSSKRLFNAEDYEEGTIEKPVYIDDFGEGSSRRRR